MKGAAMKLLPSLTLAMTALAPLSPTAAAPGAPSPYAPLAFLIGHCWKGTFPGGAVTDVHCFSWVYGDKFVRDRHVVHRGPGREDQGESLYLWDAASSQLQYLYIESAGGFSRGTVSREADVLVFPPSHYTENGEEQTYRSRWQRSGEHAYEVITEFSLKGAWTPGFRVHMQELPPGQTR
jgi:hypothetical protein